MVNDGFGKSEWNWDAFDMNEPLCCSEGSHASKICPRCGHPGKKIDSLTVKALLAVSLENVRQSTYFFCAQRDCPVVYFSTDSTFTTDQLRERVFQKEPDAGDVIVCYCFRHTVGSIRAELHETGHSGIVDQINTGIQAGACACDLRNPQGTCCLGNVLAVVKQADALPDD